MMMASQVFTLSHRKPDHDLRGALKTNLADPERLELPTSAFEAHCSIQLSYGSAAIRVSAFRKLWLEMASEEIKMVRPERFELPTFWFVARRSIQLS